MGTRPPRQEHEAPRTVRPAHGQVVRIARGPLVVSYIPTSETGRLGLTMCPGRNDYSMDGATRYAHDLGEDIRALQRGRTSMVVSLLEAPELRAIRVPSLGHSLRAAGIPNVHFPIPDQGVPRDLLAFRRLVETIAFGLCHGENIVIHCRGGLGRTGLFAGCVLRTLGFTGSSALFAVARARGPRCPETDVQRKLVLSFLPLGA